MKFRIITLLLTLSIALVACSPATAPTTESTSTDGSSTDDEIDELTAVTLGLGFIPNVQFTPFYVGISQGFYAEEGLDVSLDYGFENDYLTLVGTDELQFMIGSGDQLVLGRAQGLPVRYVMSWYTQYPVVIFAKAEEGISEPADLAGKTIGIPGPFGASYVAFRGFLEAAGLTEADVKLESIGFTQAAAISEGTVNAAVDYGVNGPIILAQEGIETTEIKLDTYLHIPANGLVTNEKTIADNPELVAKMTRATLRAIQFTLDNSDEAFEIALDAVPEAAGDNRDANRAVFDAVLDFWRPQGDLGLGESRAEDWQAVAEFMQRIGLVDTLVDADELYTNQFVGISDQ